MWKQPVEYADEAAFAAGACTDVQWADGALRLAPGSRSGSWTGPVQECAPFDWLVPSWNGAAPAGAGVRVAVCLQLEGGWTPWMDWGLWSPLSDSHRDGPRAARCAEAVIRNGILRSEQPATAFQLRLELMAAEDGASPAVHFLTASARPAGKAEPEPGEPLYHRSSPVPAYSQRNRDPRLAGRMGGAVCAAMLVNRWGEDLLPEKMAHICRSPAGNWEDPAYLAAAVGLYGYRAAALFCPLAELKREMKAGCASAAVLRTDTGHRWVVVRGFDTDADGAQWVLLNDPDADTDDAAQRCVPLEEFCAAWMGLALTVHPKDEAHAAGAPAWAPGELRAGEVPGTWALLRGGERMSLPVDLCVRDGDCRGTVCYTVKDGRVCASTAHKRFFYTDVAPTGDILLDTAAMPAGTKLTVYVVRPELTVTACLTV